MVENQIVRHAAGPSHVVGVGAAYTTGMHRREGELERCRSMDPLFTMCIVRERREASIEQETRCRRKFSRSQWRDSREKFGRRAECLSEGMAKLAKISSSISNSEKADFS